MTDFTDEQIRVLRESADIQLELERQPEPPPLLRIVDDGGALEHPITCPAAVLAARTGGEKPRCRWVRDCGQYSCTRCGGTVGPGMHRHGVLALLFGDDVESDLEPLAAWEAEIAETAARLVEEGEPEATATLKAGALLLLTHARPTR